MLAEITQKLEAKEQAFEEAEDRIKQAESALAQAQETMLAMQQRLDSLQARLDESERKNEIKKAESILDGRERLAGFQVLSMATDEEVIVLAPSGRKILLYPGERVATYRGTLPVSRVMNDPRLGVVVLIGEKFFVDKELVKQVVAKKPQKSVPVARKPAPKPAPTASASVPAPGSVDAVIPRIQDVAGYRVIAVYQGNKATIRNAAGGSDIRVKIGETIPGLGRVTNIDPTGTVYVEGGKRIPRN